MQMFDQVFSKRLNEILMEHTGKTLIFFRGFIANQIKILIEHQQSLLNDPAIIKEGQIDFSRLNDSDNWFEMISNIRASTAPLIGFYEELLAIYRDLEKANVEKIVIVENNILSPWVPCNVSYRQALRLFDYFKNDSEPDDPEIELLLKYYSDVKLLEDQNALFLPNFSLDEKNDSKIEIVSFWNGESSQEEPDPDADIRHIELGSPQDWLYCLDLTRGETQQPVLFLKEGEGVSQREQALLCAASILELPIYFDEAELYNEKIEYDEKQFLPILKRYWGENASFRPLLFYKDPDRTTETETLSQGQIIAEIVDQCESAINQEKFNNIFITAPTGAGKSILFQIPALYLAEKYDLVTIVVTPLIALMNDQVSQLKNKRHISNVACINSTINFNEREKIIKGIQSGDISMLYVAPEFLLSTHLASLLGGRKLGLVVIDEAHTVTSWGRDFRSDYWFLGNFLKKTEREGFSFPVLCLTATAVYSGENDIVNDTIQELELGRTIIHLGNVRRENISFDICQHSNIGSSNEIEELKEKDVLAKVHEYISRHEKTLIYAPYTKQVDQLYHLVPADDHRQVCRYHAGLSQEERRRSEKEFMSGEVTCLFCTKAFGMGIDVDDIKHVIHFAPSGSLADYVQEIGRAARNKNIQGIAHIDFYQNDMVYVQKLHRLSEMRQYQLKEMLKKILTIYEKKKHRNLLVSPDTFNYLFKQLDDIENKTKTGLMLLAKDLSYKYTFPVLIVRPKAMMSKNYVNVPFAIEDQFLEKFGQYAEFKAGISKRIQTVGFNNLNSNITRYSTGNTYLVDMGRIWESYYPELTFGMFKKQFFERSFIADGETHYLSPRVKVTIQFSEAYENVLGKLERVLEVIQNYFDIKKHSDQKYFTEKDFEFELRQHYDAHEISREKISILLEVFTKYGNKGDAFEQTRSQVRVLSSRTQARGTEKVYFVSNPAYINLKKYFIRKMEQCHPNNDGNVYRFYCPINSNKQIDLMPLLNILELFEWASYELRGGEKAEIFIRINDPYKIKSLVESGKYKNEILRNIHQRHINDESFLKAFFSARLNDEERWDLIEHYFLGNEDFVRTVLNISDRKKVKENQNVEKDDAWTDSAQRNPVSSETLPKGQISNMEMSNVPKIDVDSLQDSFDHSWMIYEILRCAQDVHASKVRLILNKDRLMIAHNGKDEFSIGNSRLTLEEDLLAGETNEKSVGFLLEDLAGDPSKNYRGFRECLGTLDFPVLFSSDLTEVQFSIADTHGQYTKEIKDTIDFGDTIVEYICISKYFNDKVSKENFWVFSRVNETGERYSIGFALNEKGQPRPIDEPAFCFFRTQEKTGLHFLIHAPFDLTDDHQEFKPNSERNEALISDLAVLAGDAMLYLKEISSQKGMRFLDDGIVYILPYNEKKFCGTGKDGCNIFKPFYTEIKRRFETESLIPTSDGYTSREHAYWAASTVLPRLFYDEQLCEITGDPDAEWVFVSIGREKLHEEKPALFKYLDGMVKTSVNENVILKGRKKLFGVPLVGITPTFIKNQTFEWLFTFYKWVAETKRRTELAKSVPIFVDRDGRAVAAYDDKNNLRLVLRSYGYRGYKVLHPALSENEECQKLLRKMGVFDSLEELASAEKAKPSRKVEPIARNEILLKNDINDTVVQSERADHVIQEKPSREIDRSTEPQTQKTDLANSLLSMGFTEDDLNEFLEFKRQKALKENELTETGADGKSLSESQIQEAVKPVHEISTAKVDDAVSDMTIEQDHNDPMFDKDNEDNNFVKISKENDENDFELEKVDVKIQPQELLDHLAEELEDEHVSSGETTMGKDEDTVNENDNGQKTGGFFSSLKNFFRR